jgi:hypothetical protein
MVLMLVIVIVPGILINIWLTRRERARRQRGFEVIMGPKPVLPKNDNHGSEPRAD